MKDQVIELLRRVPGLAWESDRSLKSLVPLVDEAELHPGQVLTREGRSEQEAFIVMDGFAKVSIGGHEVANVSTGEFVGEMAMLDGGPRTATVQASTPMRVLVIGPRAFRAFLGHDGVARAVASQLANRLRAADRALR